MASQQPSLKQEIATIPHQHVVWMWKSNSNPWYSNIEFNEWNPYTDVETLMIEEAYSKKLPEVVLDNYHIDFKQLIQISNTCEKNQRPVKRVADAKIELALRKERFLRNPLVPSVSFTRTSTVGNLLRAIMEYFNNSSDLHPSSYYDYHEKLLTDRNVREIMVDKAVEGLIIEGKKVGKQREGEYMAEQLLKHKRGTRKELEECCIRLYCGESFLFAKLNEFMRLTVDARYEHIWKSKVHTFGPLALFLWNLNKNFGGENITVYRGTNLSDELIEQFRSVCEGHEKDNKIFIFPAFTSTSRNLAKAEFCSGNVLFNINISEMDGYDVSPYSNFNEEEQLLTPDFGFRIRSCDFDESKKKWLIHLQTPIPNLDLLYG